MRLSNSVLMASCLLAQCSGFSMNYASSKLNMMVVPTSQRGSVQLYASEEGDGASEGASSDASTDILNSPAFLTRKLDVLKSDIAKVEEKLAERNQALEVGKAEWASQIEDLQTEVSLDY